MVYIRYGYYYFILYGIISFSFSYYGEMITYLGMTMPMAVFDLISRLKNPYNGNKAEVSHTPINRLYIAPYIYSETGSCYNMTYK